MLKVMKFVLHDYMRYGLSMTLVVIVCLGVMELTGQNKTFDNSPLTFFFNTIAPAIIWYLGIAARKRMQKGKLTFKEGVSEGLKISVVAGVSSFFVFLFYYLYVNPAIVSYAREVYHMYKATDAQIIQTDLTVQIIGTIIGGTLYSALVSFFLRSKSK